MLLLSRAWYSFSLLPSLLSLFFPSLPLSSTSFSFLPQWFMSDLDGHRPGEIPMTWVTGKTGKTFLDLEGELSYLIFTERDSNICCISKVLVFMGFGIICKSTRRRDLLSHKRVILFYFYCVNFFFYGWWNQSYLWIDLRKQCETCFCLKNKSNVDICLKCFFLY